MSAIERWWWMWPMLPAAESQKFELADHAHLIGPADGAIRERFVTILPELQPHVCSCTTCNNCRAAVALPCILLLKIDISLLDLSFSNNYSHHTPSNGYLRLDDSDGP